MKLKKIKNIVTHGGLILLFCLFIGLPIVNAQGFSEHLWKDRLIILFSPQKDHVPFVEQRLAFEQKSKEMKDRDLLLYQLFPEEGMAPGGKKMDTARVRQWRKKWAVRDEQFLMILVGKDGGTKYKATKNEDPSIIFDLIDSMPMRKAEIKGN